jgi:hypothetical protein
LISDSSLCCDVIAAVSALTGKLLVSTGGRGRDLLCDVTANGPSEGST